MGEGVLHIAYFSPLPPQRSGIADYSRELLPALLNLAEITVFVPDPGAVDSDLAAQLRLESIGNFDSRRREFDLALYHIGNSEHHDEITRLALRYPGVIVLHDYYLHHSVAQRTVGAGDRFAYWREMGYELGPDGVRRAKALDYGLESPVFDVGLNSRLLDASLGVLVHSNYSEQLVRRQGYRGPMAVVPAQIAPLNGRSRRADLNLSQDALLFASYGLITREKQIANILEALYTLRREIPEAHYLLVGESMPDVPITNLIRKFGLEEAVHQIGYVAHLADFVDWIQTADIVVNLRNPTVGETSATALRAMAAGRPLIVSDHGWYSELPPDAALKTAPGDDAALLDAMRLLGQSAALRDQMGLAGQRLTSAKNNPHAVAGQIMLALDKIKQAVRILG